MISLSYFLPTLSMNRIPISAQFSQFYVQVSLCLKSICGTTQNKNKTRHVYLQTSNKSIDTQHWMNVRHVDVVFYTYAMLNKTEKKCLNDLIWKPVGIFTFMWISNRLLKQFLNSISLYLIMLKMIAKSNSSSSLYLKLLKITITTKLSDNNNIVARFITEYSSLKL